MSKFKLLPFLCLIGGPVTLVIAYREYKELAGINANGAEANGIVVEASALKTGKGRTSHSIVVVYHLPI